MTSAGENSASVHVAPLGPATVDRRSDTGAANGSTSAKKILHLKEKPIRYEKNNYTFVYFLAGDAEGDILPQCQRWMNIINSSENKIYYQHISISLIGNSKD